MASAKITLYGMTKYMQDHEDDLFVNLDLPEGMEKDTLVDVILYKGAEFGVLYGDPYFMQSMIGIWSAKYQHTFERWVAALSIEYNPLENYDRMEEWSDENSGTSETSTSVTNSNSVDVSTTSGTEVDATTETQVSAYDSATYQPQNKVIEDRNESNTITTGTESEGSSSTTGSVTDSETKTRTGRAHGNIGVTTSQQMLEAEWAVARLNIYEEAADLFLSEFCIFVY